MATRNSNGFIVRGVVDLAINAADYVTGSVGRVDCGSVLGLLLPAAEAG